ncbi:MAG: acyltransferase family protein [Candidatus Spyradenecus sp.]
MPSIPESLSRKFTNMSFCCACLVVFIHIYPRFDPGSWQWWIHQFIANGITRVAVPYFFLASGFFLACHFGEEGWRRREVGKRVFSVLVPCYLTILLWAILKIGLAFVLPPTAGLPFLDLLAQTINWKSTTGLYPFACPELYSLWFLRTLFVFVLVSPLVVRPLTTSRKSGLSFLAALFLLHLLLLPYTYILRHIAPFLSRWPLFAAFPFERIAGYGSYIFTYGFSMSGFCYFSLGIFLCHYTPARPLTSRQTCLCGAIGVFLLVLSFFGTLHALKPGIYFAILALPFLLATLWRVMSSRALLPPWLLACNLPIYLLHLIFLNLFSRAEAFGCLSLPAYNSLLGYATRGGLAIGLSIGTALAVKRLCPRLANLWLGGR